MRRGKSREIQELGRERKASINWDAVDDELFKNDGDTGEQVAEIDVEQEMENENTRGVKMMRGKRQVMIAMQRMNIGWCIMKKVGVD